MFPLLSPLILPLKHHLLASSATWQVDTIFGTISSGNDAFNTYLSLTLNFLYSIIGLVTVIRIVYGGFRYVQASGNAGEAKLAKRVILHAFYGLLLVLSAVVVTNTFIQF